MTSHYHYHIMFYLIMVDYPMFFLSLSRGTQTLEKLYNYGVVAQKISRRKKNKRKIFSKIRETKYIENQEVFLNIVKKIRGIKN